jgi:TonB family protein
MFAALLLAKITVLLTIAWAITYTLRAQSADLRHRVWTLALAGSLALPLLTATLPSWHSTAVTHALAEATAPITPAPHSRITPMVVTAGPAQISPANLLLLAWLAGAAVMFLRLIRGFLSLAWISSRATPIGDEATMFGLTRPVRLLESPKQQSMPLTWGFLRPAIVLPPDARNWDETRRALVLAHELAHIARADWPIQILAELTRAVYWFHPLAWVAANRLRQESERAADDAVLNSGVRPTDYAAQLLDLARSLKNADRVWSTALAMARSSDLERRFIAMLNPSLNRRRTSRRTAFVTTCAAVALLLPLAALKAPAQDRAAKFTGTILDPRNAPVPNATIVLTNPVTQAKEMTTSDAAGRYAFATVNPGDYKMSVLQPGFTVYTNNVALTSGQDASQDVFLVLGPINETISVTGEQTQPFISDNHAQPARLPIGGNVQAAKLIRKVRPPYPAEAKAARIQGSVMLNVLIGADGRPNLLRVQTTDVEPSLAKAAVEAVSQWEYQPTLLNGQPVEVVTNIAVNFTLMP